ncbi:MAG: cytosol aminopeptidase [Candidatus Magasanikbacteria bacterium]|nr:cytosol aminopeptidase [Candidatus Magasanikbacteria bacterium]
MQVNIFDAIKSKTGAMAVFLFKGASLPTELRALDKQLGGMIEMARRTADFKEEKNEIMLLYTGGLLPTPRILLVGLGEAGKFDATVWARAVGTAAAALQSRKICEMAILIPAVAIKKLGASRTGLTAAKAAGVAAYQFSKYKTDQEAVFPPFNFFGVAGLAARDAKNFLAGAAEGAAIAAAMNFVRDLGNTPPMEMTPTALAQTAKNIQKEFPKVKVTVLEKAEMKKLGMGGVLGVSLGSNEPPKFIVMEYFGAARARGVNVFVGKGITFDSGGLSIKPADRMDEMKFDMLGGAAVMGAVRLIAAQKLPVNVIGLIPATENLSGGSAYRPGDILRALNGKTIEILNTDAEGRLILADALSYAAKYKPKTVIDLATLTGAIVVALSDQYAGLFGNDEKFLGRVLSAGASAGDAVWPMPLNEQFTNLIKSEVADMRNTTAGKSEGGGASTAAAFLKEFTSFPWAHLDIAGTAWSMKPQSWIRVGASGFGVHLLYELAKRFV